MNNKDIALFGVCVPAILLSLFWGIHYLATGDVAVVEGLDFKFLGISWVIEYPSGISRLWDILFGPLLFTTLMVVISSIDDLTEKLQSSWLDALGWGMTPAFIIAGIVSFSFLLPIFWPWRLVVFGVLLLILHVVEKDDHGGLIFWLRDITDLRWMRPRSGLLLGYVIGLFYGIVLGVGLTRAGLVTGYVASMILTLPILGAKLFYSLASEITRTQRTRS